MLSGTAFARCNRAGLDFAEAARCALPGTGAFLAVCAGPGGWRCALPQDEGALDDESEEIEAFALDLLHFAVDACVRECQVPAGLEVAFTLLLLAGAVTARGPEDAGELERAVALIAARCAALREEG